MCPADMTNLRDGSALCDSPIIPGTNLKLRYAVIVSFGILLNGTDLVDVATKVGLVGLSALALPCWASTMS